MKLAERAQETGRAVSIVVYPDVQHHFDGAEVHGRRYVAAARGGKGATVEYNPQAHEDSEKQVQKFLAEHMSISGSSPAARSGPSTIAVMRGAQR